MEREYMTPLEAIKERCLDCCAYSKEEVKMCVSEDCALWPYRLGHSPYKKKPTLTDEQRKAMRERMLKVRNGKTVLIDTREHEAHRKRVTRQIEKLGYKVKLVKLDTGDYMIEGRPDIVVDRKHNLDEVLKNMCSRDSSRFWREIRRAKEQRKHLAFVIEHSPTVNKLTDVANWQSKYSRVTGRQLMERMYRVEIGWGIDWVFTDRRNVGKTIVGLLEESKSAENDRTGADCMG